MGRTCEPDSSSVCWDKANFIQNFPQPKSWFMQTTSWEQKICYSPLGMWNRTANWVFPVLQMKRQHLCRGCSSVLGQPCLATTAGSWSCHFCKAICHLLSGVNSAVLWNEPGCKAKTSFFLLWRVIFKLDHSATPLRAAHRQRQQHSVGEVSMAGGKEKLEQELLQLVSPPKDVYCTSHLTRWVGIITWGLCSCHFCLNEVVYVWLYNTVLQADPNLFIQLQNTIQEFNLTFNISCWTNK